MSESNPAFTILVPTRDRPEMVRYCLESLKRQTFTDFEVIVSDNHAARPCKGVFDKIADARFRYVTPPSPLSMPDNWEFASQFARGQYTGVLIDKTVLMPSALQAVSESVCGNRAEIVSWWNDGYSLKNEAAGNDVGSFYPAYKPCQPREFDPGEELRRRFSWDVRRSLEGKHYYWGKICFGMYHRDLIERIRSRLGRLFLPVSPDYTSMLAALGLATSALDLGRPFLISFSSALSTGASTARDPAAARNYLMQTCPAAIDNLPLPGLYASQHNIVAHDYAQLQQRIGGRFSPLRLNRDNLILRAKEDLEQQQWNDGREKSTQEAILAAHLKTMRIGVLARYRLARFLQEASARSARFFLDVRRLLSPLARRYPKLKKFAKTLLREREQLPPAPDPYAWEHREYFSSIIEAAEASDRYYDRQRKH